MIRSVCLLLMLVSCIMGLCQNHMEIESSVLDSITAVGYPIGEDIAHIYEPYASNSEESVVISESIYETIEEYAPDQPIFIDYKNSKYWKRYKSLLTAGWVCLGTGVAFGVGGYFLLFAAYNTAHDAAADALAITGSLMLFSSPVLIVASIPLLSTAYYNRYKAKKMKLDVGVSKILLKSASPYAMQTPALSLSLNF